MEEGWATEPRCGWDPHRTYTGDPRDTYVQFVDGGSVHFVPVRVLGIEHGPLFRLPARKKPRKLRETRQREWREAYREYVNRNSEICRMRSKGMTYARIGLIFNLSGERIRQIVHAWQGHARL